MDKPFLITAPNCCAGHGHNAFWGYSLGICPNCSSKSSAVNDGSQTIVGYPPFRDSTGKEHRHDENHKTKYGTCADCNHTWVEIYFAGLCDCGWPNDGEYTEGQPDKIRGKYGQLMCETNADGSVNVFTDPKWFGKKKPVEFRMELGIGIVNPRGVARVKFELW